MRHKKLWGVVGLAVVAVAVIEVFLFDMTSAEAFRQALGSKENPAYAFAKDVIIGGGAIIALWLSLERRRIDHKQAENAIKTTENAIEATKNASRTTEITHADQMAKRLFESAKLLTDASLTARLAGITGLWGIAQQTKSRNERQMVFGLLCGFIRSQTQEQQKALELLETELEQAEKDNHPQEDIKRRLTQAETPSQDVRQALSLLSDPPPEDLWQWADYPRDFSGFFLRSYSIAGITLENCRLDQATLGAISGAREHPTVLRNCTANRLSLEGDMVRNVRITGGSFGVLEITTNVIVNTAIEDAEIRMFDIRADEIWDTSLRALHISVTNFKNEKTIIRGIECNDKYRKGIDGFISFTNVDFNTATITSKIRPDFTDCTARALTLNGVQIPATKDLAASVAALFPDLPAA